MDFYEYTEQALKARNASKEALSKMFADKLQAEKDAAELAELRKKQAEQEQKDRDERIAKEASEKAEREKAERQKAAQADTEACDAARKKKTEAAWKTYLEKFPTGACQQEATQALAALAEPKPSTDAKPEPSTPHLAPKQSTAASPTDAKGAVSSPTKAASTDSKGGAISPLVWIGFGSAAAFGIAGGVLGGLSYSESKDLQQKCINNLCSSDLMGDVDSMKL